jgi:hypothetical protein
MKKRLTLNTVAESPAAPSPRSRIAAQCGQGDAPSAAGRPLRGGSGLGRARLMHGGRGVCGGALEPVRHVATIRLADLKEVDAQKERLLRNTAQFVAGTAPTTCC